MSYRDETLCNYKYDFDKVHLVGYSYSIKNTHTARYCFPLKLCFIHIYFTCVCLFRWKHIKHICPFLCLLQWFAVTQRLVVKYLLYVNIRKRLFFTKGDFNGQENSKRYVTHMIGIFWFVTKRYIWYVGTKNQPI